MIRMRVANALAGSLSALESSGSLHDQDRLANFDRLYNIYRRAGRAECAMRSVIDGWQLAQRVLDARPWGELSPAERVYILRLGYQMAWFGDSIGESAHGRDALRRMGDIARNYRPDSPELAQNPRLAMALSDYKNLETAVARERTFPPNEVLARRHALEALTYVEAARSPPGAGAGAAPASVTQAAAHVQRAKLTRNAALGTQGSQFAAEAGGFCNLAEQFYKNHQEDERALSQVADCAEIQATLNPRTIAPQVQTMQILDGAIARDGANASLRAAKVLMGSRVLEIYRNEMRNALDPELQGCDDACAAVATNSVGDMTEVFRLGFVPSSGSQVERMLDLLEHVRDPGERRRLSNMVAEALQPRAAEPHARLLYRAAIARAFVVSGQALRELGREEEAEREYRRAAEYRRNNPAPLVASQHWEIFQQCVVESDLLGWQVAGGLAQEAVATAGSLRGVCEEYLNTVVPWDLTLRGLVVEGYSRLLELELGLPDSDDMVRHASAFVTRFGRPADGSQYSFIYFQDEAGRLRPQRTSFIFDEARPVSGSTVGDFEARNRNFGWQVTPVSASEFLRRAEARAQLVGRPLPEVARETWAEAFATAMREDERMAEQPIDQLTVEQLDALYQRAAAILNNAPAAVAPADPRDS